MTIYDMAIAAAEAADCERQKSAKMQHDQDTVDTLKFLSNFGIDPDGPFPVIVDGLNITLPEEGIILRAGRALYGEDSYLRLKGECPYCGQMCWSQPIYILADLGQALRNFRPTSAHDCPCSKMSHFPSLTERLENIIREIVREEL